MKIPYAVCFCQHLNFVKTRYVLNDKIIDYSNNFNVIEFINIKIITIINNFIVIEFINRFLLFVVIPKKPLPNNY